MSALNKLLRLVKPRKRIGRGGDRGGTSGKGHKGQKARSGGKVKIQFEGGQMPLTRRLPKRGFTNAPFKKFFEILNLSSLQKFFKENEVVNKDLLVKKGLIASKKSLVKILAKGSLSKKLIVHADSVSKGAKESIINQGGEIHLIKENSS